uniref:Multidrug efflux pump Tap n=1 Tax=Thermosporothrix sp. COM3 TaxID=2490863 RepID=A0A455SNX2_9CHLR|nr:MFS transporter [Thermosporothrix sp. COM3]
MHFPLMARDPYQALRFREYRLLLIGSFVASVGEQMLTLAIGWELYERTHSAFLLGLVGLIQLFPALLLLPYGGFAADRYSRKRILVLAQAVLIIASLGLAAVSLWHGALVLVYVCLLLIGSATAFITPASTALLAQIVPEDVFENAATWSSSSWQLATVIGPALGGVMLAWISSSAFIYVLHAVMALTFALLLLPLRVRPLNRRDQQRKERHAIWRSLGEGVSFLRHTPILLAAMTLDLFAVLFGGATTLLPVFADEVLRVGPEGLGWLRAAPSIGALCMAFFVAHRPPLKRAGFTLLLSVIGFGVATILFGLSRSFWLSLLVLFLLGGLDNLSVVIRETLALTRTPDEMRGRVAALNGLFVNASSQLGGFESGLMAQLFGPTLSVVGGGIGTIIVVLIVALIWPELRRLRTLREVSAPPVQDVLQQENEV